MPVQAEDGGADWFLDVLAHPPVILRLEVADRDESSATTNCKFVLQWRPLDEGGGSVDPEDDQCGLPYPLLLGPHIGITVGSTCHYTVTFGSPINTCYVSIVFLQFMSLNPLVATLLVNMDFMVIRTDSNLCPIAVPCVAGDGFQQKLMKGHLVWVWSLSVTLVSPVLLVVHSR